MHILYLLVKDDGNNDNTSLHIFADTLNNILTYFHETKG